MNYRPLAGVLCIFGLQMDLATSGLTSYHDEKHQTHYRFSTNMFVFVVIKTIMTQLARYKSHFGEGNKSIFSLSLHLKRSTPKKLKTKPTMNVNTSRDIYSPIVRLRSKHTLQDGQRKYVPQMQLLSERREL